MLKNKIFAIGDIHGCHGRLRSLLDRLPYDPERDCLVFLGDYINRGPDSKKVVDCLLELQASGAHTVFLKGNHEQALLEYAATGEVDTLRVLRMMGIESTAESYGCSLGQLRDLRCLPGSHRDFFHNLQLFYVEDGYLFVHADMDEALIGRGDDQTLSSELLPHGEAAMVSSRRLASEGAQVAGYVTVFGHVPFESPLVTEGLIGIDTGAVYGNFLTAVELPDGRFYHA